MRFVFVQCCHCVWRRRVSELDISSQFDMIKFSFSVETVKPDTLLFYLNVNLHNVHITVEAVCLLFTPFSSLNKISTNIILISQ